MQEQKQTVFSRDNGAVTIYACGGTGINIVKRLMASLRASDAQFANAKFIFIDTSEANLDKTIDPSSVYLIPGVSGSGKKRDENAKVIVKHIPDIMTKFPPSTELSIFVGSLSGGSGSVTAPMCMSYARERGLPAVAIGVGSNDSIIDLSNTFKTLKTYAGIPERLSKSATVIYRENASPDPEDQKRVDHNVCIDISILLTLFSRQHSRLDDKDLYNWINYESPTGLKPALTSLDFVYTEGNLNEVGTILSVATLAGEDVMSSLFGQIPPFHVIGISENHGEKAMHHVISAGKLATKISELEKHHEELDRANRVVVAQEVLKSGDLNDDGLVL